MKVKICDTGDTTREDGERFFSIQDVLQVGFAKNGYPTPWFVSLRHGETFNVSADDYERVKAAFTTYIGE